MSHPQPVRLVRADARTMLYLSPTTAGIGVYLDPDRTRLIGRIHQPQSYRPIFLTALANEYPQPAHGVLNKSEAARLLWQRWKKSPLAASSNTP